MKKLVLVALLAMTWSLRAQQPVVPSAPSAPGAKPLKPEPAPVKEEDKCTVEGNIYSAKTGEPLKKAEVHLQRIGGPGPMPVQHGATTDAAGHFLSKESIRALIRCQPPAPGTSRPHTAVRVSKGPAPP